MTTSPTATATGTNAPPVAGTQIVISGFLYNPVNLMVKPGATVTVVNQDAVAHTVTASPTGGGIPFDTGTINGGATGTFTAPTTPGTYPYICTFHAKMHGVLTVSS
jgi:plastocyanin